MILILKSTTSNKTKEVAWSEEVVNYLISHGAHPEKYGFSEVYYVSDVDDVYEKLYMAHLI